MAALEAPPIGWQLFILGSSQSDSAAFSSLLDTYATRLLAEALRWTKSGSVAVAMATSPDRRELAGWQEEPVRYSVAIYGMTPNERTMPYQTGR